MFIAPQPRSDVRVTRGRLQVQLRKIIHASNKIIVEIRRTFSLRPVHRGWSLAIELRPLTIDNRQYSTGGQISGLEGVQTRLNNVLALKFSALVSLARVIGQSNQAGPPSYTLRWSRLWPAALASAKDPKWTLFAAVSRYEAAKLILNFLWEYLPCVAAWIRFDYYRAVIYGPALFIEALTSAIETKSKWLATIAKAFEGCLPILKIKSGARQEHILPNGSLIFRQSSQSTIKSILTQPSLRQKPTYAGVGLTIKSVIICVW